MKQLWRDIRAALRGGLLHGVGKLLLGLLAALGGATAALPHETGDAVAALQGREQPDGPAR